MSPLAALTCAAAAGGLATAGGLALRLAREFRDMDDPAGAMIELAVSVVALIAAAMFGLAGWSLMPTALACSY